MHSGAPKKLTHIEVVLAWFMLLAFDTQWGAKY
jgi:hypothetical protein